MSDDQEAEVDEGVEPAVVVEDVETWAKLPEALLYDTEISDKAIRIFGCLYRHGVTPGSCYPGKKRIAECIGGSARSVDRPLLRLLEKGWIRRYKRWTKAGMRAANGYALALDPARAKRNASTFERNPEPDELRQGRIQKAEAAFEQRSEAPPAQESANGSVRASEREQEREPVKESQLKTTPLPPSPEPAADATLFGDKAPAPSARAGEGKKAQVDRHLPAFLAKYPQNDSTEVQIRRALTRALKVTNAETILKGLDPWIKAWNAGRIMKSAANWLDDQCWTVTPSVRAGGGSSSRAQNFENSRARAFSTADEITANEAGACPTSPQDTELIKQRAALVRENMNLNLKRRARGLDPLPLPESLESTL